jgi:hypothetical protein
MCGVPDGWTGPDLGSLTVELRCWKGQAMTGLRCKGSNRD